MTNADPDPLGGELFGRNQRWTAALSIASNRASKIELLRDAGFKERASRYAVSLSEDVEAFLARYKRCGGCTPTFAKRLREQVPTP